MSDQPQPPQSPTPVAPAPADPQAEARQWAMFAHLAALIGVIIPFGNVLGPLVVWLVKKDQIPAVNDQGKEALNFQISMTIYMIVSAILMAVFIGFLLLPAVALTDLIFVIIAAIAANEGKMYRYPLTIRLIK